MLDVTLYIEGCATFSEVFEAIDRARHEAVRIYEATGQQTSGFESFDFDLRSGGFKIDLRIRKEEEDPK